MKILRDGVYFATGDSLQSVADIAGEDVSRYTFDVDDYRAYKIAEINAACESELSRLRAGYPRSEVVSWDQQVRAVNAYMADTNADTPLLSGIAGDRGVTVSVLADKVLAKVSNFTAVAAPKIGKRQRLKKQLEAATTPDEMRGVHW